MLKGRRNPFVAHEGLPLLLLSALVCLLAYQYLDLLWFVAALALLVFLFAIFRDPYRRIPPSPLGVVSPVDGTVLDIAIADRGALKGEAHRIIIRVNSFGTYTARSPVEGKIMDLNSLSESATLNYPTNPLWVQTDEGDDVVLQFRGYRYGLAPSAFARYGERIGQGMRCAYLRLARFAEVDVPITSKILVEPGQALVAGRDLIAKLPSP